MVTKSKYLTRDKKLARERERRQTHCIGAYMIVNRKETIDIAQIYRIRIVKQKVKSFNPMHNMFSFIKSVYVYVYSDNLFLSVIFNFIQSCFFITGTSDDEFIIL